MDYSEHRILRHLLFAPHYQLLTFNVTLHAVIQYQKSDLCPLACALHDARKLCNHAACIRVTSQWAPWRLESTAYRLFAKPFVQTSIKNTKIPRHWPL